MKLKGKVAIITGASRGLGRASAVEMAREGAHLVILGRTASDIEITSRIVAEVGHPRPTLAIEARADRVDAIRRET